jgi:uncharacterized LabA/DUF88 family protein
MANGTDPNSSLAVLIDADNANPSILEGLFSEVAKLGVASVKRIYGDWTTPNLTSWKTVLLEFSILPIQQFRYTTGKNSTDSAMIIDAMDLLYTGQFTGFCLVSSDSDFTRLASRIRESGKRVYGFGERKTPRAFVSACDRFIYTDVFVQLQDDVSNKGLHPRSSRELRCDTKLLNLVRSAIEASSDETGWAQLSPVGSYINKTANDFDPRNYGFSKLSELITAIGMFEIDRKENRIYVKHSRKKATSLNQKDLCQTKSRPIGLNKSP